MYYYSSWWLSTAAPRPLNHEYIYIYFFSFFPILIVVWSSPTSFPIKDILPSLKAFAPICFLNLYWAGGSNPGKKYHYIPGCLFTSTETTFKDRKWLTTDCSLECNTCERWQLYYLHTTYPPSKTLTMNSSHMSASLFERWSCLGKINSHQSVTGSNVL